MVRSSFAVGDGGDGWGVTFLGGSLPADDLRRYAGVTNPDVVVISCTVPLFLPGARRGFAAVTDLGLPAIAAGAAFGHDDVRARRLGASGWIGPTADLTTALYEISTREPPTTPTPPEAFALELAAQDLQRSCLSPVVGAHAADGHLLPQQMASTRTDLDYILNYLTTSIDLGDDEIFTDFTAWLAHVLEMRGVPLIVLDRSLDIIGDVLASAAMTEAARLCTTPHTTQRHTDNSSRQPRRGHTGRR